MNNDTGKIITALVAGAAVGAVVGLLFAPEKGAETRNKINDSLADLKDIIKEKTEEQYEQFTDLKNRVLASILDKADDVIDEAEDEITEHA